MEIGDTEKPELTQHMDKSSNSLVKYELCRQIEQKRDVANLQRTKVIRPRNINWRNREKQVRSRVVYKFDS